MSGHDQRSADGYVETVCGPVAARDLGVTLPHEHLIVDGRCYWQPDAAGADGADAPVTIERLGEIRNAYGVREDLHLSDEEEAVAELAQYAQHGGRTLLDVSLPDIGRDVRALRRIAERTGVQVVAGCGHYVHISHPDGLAEQSAETIAARIVADLTEGIDGSDIRAGVIGEIGTSDPLHEVERTVLAAAAQAQQATGAAITLHLPPTALIAHEVLDLLAGAGADLERVVVGHQDTVIGLRGHTREAILEHHAEIAARGAYVEYDCFGCEGHFPASSYHDHGFWLPSDRERVELLGALIERGHLDRLLISQDICRKTHLTRYGGFGYAHILRDTAGHFAEAGLDAAVLERLMVENPRRLLARPREHGRDDGTA